MTQPCTSCGNTAVEPDHAFCNLCGASLEYGEAAAAVTQTCRSCGREAAPGARFCRFDGTPLGAAGGRQDEPAQSAGDLDFRSRAIVFWNRFGLLINTTAVLALPALLLAPQTPPLALILLVPAITAWIVALFDWPVLERLVSGCDARFQQAYHRDLSEAGRIRRWVIRPIIALQARWIRFAEGAPSEAIFAGLRWFGYVVSAMLAIGIIALIVYAIIVAILLAIIVIVSIFALGVMLSIMGEGGGKRTIGRSLGGLDPLMAAGRRGRELYRDRGGFFDRSERVGRIDKDGRIFSGRGGFFDVDEQIGEIDKDGRIYETDGRFFSTKTQVGRVDDDGQIYEGGGGFFDQETRVGKVDSEGKIHRGRGGFFDVDQQVGKSK